MSWPIDSIHRMVDGRFRHACPAPPLAIMTTTPPFDRYRMVKVAPPARGAKTHEFDQAHQSRPAGRRLARRLHLGRGGNRVAGLDVRFSWSPYRHRHPG